MNTLPVEVSNHLRIASSVVPQRTFTCSVFQGPWDQFVETWAPIVHVFLLQALGPYGKEPLSEILELPMGMHSSGATASFSPGTGQVRLCSSMAGWPGQTLEKLIHEFTHASLADFPEGDAFYEEGQVDYATWIMAHAPVWEPYRNQAIQAASYNIAQRRDRAMKDLSDWDRKRWAGGLYASRAYGPWIVARLQSKKAARDFTW